MFWSLQRKCPKSDFFFWLGGRPSKLWEGVFGSESRFKLERPMKEAVCLAEVLGYGTTYLPLQLLYASCR